MKLKTLPLAIALALGAAVAQADPVLIDDFNDPFAPGVHGVVDQTNGLGAVSQTLTGLAGVVGGARTLSIDCIEGCAAGSFTDLAALEVSGGALKWTNGDLARSVASITWDGAPAAGGLNFNMLAAGNAIVASILNADLGFNYLIELETFGGGSTQLLSGTLNAVLPGSPETAFYDLAWFGLANGNYFLDGLPFTISQIAGGVDLTNVDRIRLSLENVAASCYQSPGTACSVAVDLRIDDIMVVPEPGTIALAGVALLGLAGVSRRNRRV